MNGLLKKFMEYAIGNIAVLILGFISAPLVTRLTGKVDYGKSSIFIMVTSLFVLILSVGLDQAYVRYFNNEEEENRAGLLGKCLLITTSISLLVSTVILIFYKPISVYMVGEVSFTITLLLVIHGTCSIIGNFANVHIRMKQRGKAYSLLSVINKLSYLILLVLIYMYYKDNYRTIILATVLSNIVNLVWAIGFEFEDWKNIFKFKKLNVSNKELIRYGIPMIFSMGLTWIFQSIDKVTLNYYDRTYAENGLYSAAMTIIAILNIVQTSFATFWVPVAYEKYKTDREDKQFFVNINEMISAAMLLVSVGLIFTKDIIIKMLGPDYAGAQFVFPFLVLMPIMYTISETTVMGINFAKKTKYHIVIAGVSALANLIGNIILVPGLGARGAAISTGLSYVIFFILRTYYSNKFYKVNFKLKKLWIGLIGVYALATYSTSHKFDITILILTIINVGLIFLLYKNSFMEIINMVKGLIPNKDKK